MDESFLKPEENHPREKESAGEFLLQDGYSHGEEKEDKNIDTEQQSLFDGFLDSLREKGVRVSTPEWLQFLQVVKQKTSTEELEDIVDTNQLLNKIRLFAQITLVKDNTEESAFHEAFDEYFKEGLDTVEGKNNKEPKIKESLGIKDIKENLDLSEEERQGEERVHGGLEDQHNDILQKKDLTKQGGGDTKDEAQRGRGKEKTDIAKNNEENYSDSRKEEGGRDGGGQHSMKLKAGETGTTEEGILTGGGKGKSVYAERLQFPPITQRGETLTTERIEKRKLMSKRGVSGSEWLYW